MAKITFMGAGSTVFVRNIIGDCLCTPALQDSEIALYDIDATRLKESLSILETLNRNLNQNRAKIAVYHGEKNRRAALKGANYVVNAIQVGGYKPSTVIDFDIPKKFGLRQTIADTTGIGGIFRALRTVPIILDFARDMREVCPKALLLNYTNPMPTISTALTRAGGVKFVGLCHSVQVCAESLVRTLNLHGKYKKEDLQWKVAGINHMGWLLEISHKGKDLYPEIKKVAADYFAQVKKRGGGAAVVKAARAKFGDEASKKEPLFHFAHDMVRLYLMLNFGYYITESSEHNAEYHPYFIKDKYPKFIEEFNIPLDEYPRRCIAQIKGWKEQAKTMVGNKNLTHTRSHEYGSVIMEAMETDKPAKIGGNVLNNGLITNLPRNMAVEVPCLIDRNGVQGVYVGDLPEQCAALNRTNINTHLLTVEAILTGKKDHIYQAAMLDPHTRAELSIDDIRAMCDALIKAHGKMMPTFK
jgi:alpha-galactosidase